MRMSTVDAIYVVGLENAPAPEDVPSDMEDELDQEDESEAESSEQSSDNGKGKAKQELRPSLYVHTFEKMMEGILQDDAHLFTSHEHAILDRYKALSYPARYALVRLLLRKPATWYSVFSMQNYKRELGEDGLVEAMEEISISKPEEPKSPPVVIDLTLDSDCEDAAPSSEPSQVPGPSATQVEDEKPATEFDLSHFCKDETFMSLQELLDCLTVPQLREVATTLKVSKASKKSVMVHDLLFYASGQSVIDVANKKKQRCNALSSFFHVRKTSQETRLRQMVLDKLGECIWYFSDGEALLTNWIDIQLTSSSTEYPQPNEIMLPALLTCFRKRSYANFDVDRTTVVWQSREILLEYERALDLHARISELEDEDMRSSPAAAATGLVPPVKRSFTAPPGSPKVSASPDIQPQQAADGQDDEEEKNESQRARRARQVRAFAEEHRILETWRELLETKRWEDTHIVRTPGFERFETGYIYTRMASKLAGCMGPLKEFQLEVDILNELLGQCYWRQRSRGDWYNRRALVQQRHIAMRGRKAGRPAKLTLARDWLLEALHDERTGTVHRPVLVRRLYEVETKLEIPEEEQSSSHIDTMRMAQQVDVVGVRVWESPEKEIEKDKDRDKDKGKDDGEDKKSEQSTKGLQRQGMVPIPSVLNCISAYFPVVKAAKAPAPELSKATVPQKQNVKLDPVSASKTPPLPNTSNNWKWKGKSLWQGRGGDSVYVEIFALQQYEDDGYKGFHSENMVLTTIFGLLFWDILFSPVPGAFVTPFQVAPLDLVEDSFYFARKTLIDKRMEEIRYGDAKEILLRHDNTYRDTNTFCTGCLGGDALCHVCKLFCDDYRGRRSGMPDLIVWDIKRKECRFVEVKGPNDRASETQQRWFDSLLAANIQVDLCHVIEKHATKKLSAKKRKRLLSAAAAAADDTPVPKRHRST
ncbi:hypothetical protein FISHEDRAFT_56908 [Fistulina hepatica ATCC 64428]|nr:hypothetical protein FISHEDRAFT_56908 [Fistulina hepatica ATCC 64428]